MEAKHVIADERTGEQSFCLLSAVSDLISTYNSQLDKLISNQNT
jgi:hypothetical protein